MEVVGGTGVEAWVELVDGRVGRLAVVKNLFRSSLWVAGEASRREVATAPFLLGRPLGGRSWPRSVGSDWKPFGWVDAWDRESSVKPLDGSGRLLTATKPDWFEFDDSFPPSGWRTFWTPPLTAEGVRWVEVGGLWLPFKGLWFAAASAALLLMMALLRFFRR